ncbi:MAG: hypothetical protein RR623_00895 [Bacilli bacterium]
MSKKSSVAIEDTVTISLKEYNRLLDRDDWLSWLECAGVDNSEAWDYACEMKREHEESEDYE